MAESSNASESSLIETRGFAAFPPDRAVVDLTRSDGSARNISYNKRIPKISW